MTRNLSIVYGAVGIGVHIVTAPWKVHIAITIIQSTALGLDEWKTFGSDSQTDAPTASMKRTKNAASIQAGFCCVNL
jgi:hypothetical protein